MKLKQAIREFRSTDSYKKQSDIHWFVWLLENPKSPLRLSGAVNLNNHDIIHVLLDREMDIQDEAYVIGFTMGNSRPSSSFARWAFRISARWLYPDGYRFNKTDMMEFDRGYDYGHDLQTKNIHEKTWTEHSISENITNIREKMGINIINTKKIEKESCCK